VDNQKILNHKVISKTNIALLCVIGMIGSFLVSRAFLSFFTFAFGLNALRDVHPKQWLKQKYWLLGVGWVGMYALSWFWTDDKSLWNARFEVKAPVLLLPLAFAFLPAFTVRQLQVFAVSAGTILLSGALYSASFLWGNLEYYLYEYHMAHVLPTPVYNDHIRFSASIALFIVWCAWFWRHTASVAVKWFMAIVAIILSAYLHLLAARTGLIIWYFFLLSWSVYFGLRKNKLIGISIIVAVFTVAFYSFQHVPTLKKRIDYIFYTYDLYQKGEISGIYSDMGRMISYDVAGKVIKSNLAIGVGSGDMMAEITNEQVLLPHNQFLIVLLAGGIPALLLFLAWVFYPLSEVRKNRHSFYFLVVWFSLLLPLMIEPMLEVQFGLFVYLFFLLWQRHAMKHVPVQE
jgi:O-antigen ligase